MISLALVTVIMALIAEGGIAEVLEHYSSPTLLVRLSQGVISGVRESANQSRVFYSFKGIPYAQPPVGNLRLQNPVKASRWSGVRDGSWVAPHCPQLKNNNHSFILGHEDCLYLNVFTPQPHSSGYPVLVFIHGGYFLYGGANDYPPLPLLTRDIVLVVVQYRLGVLGFLSSEDSVLPGNLGLKDQNKALQWIQENIRDLGGDPQKVTLCGEGAGAASIHYQILSPYSQGLFSGAILQSGSSLGSGMLRSDHKIMASKIDIVFKCGSRKSADPEDINSIRLLKCLQALPYNILTASYTNLYIWNKLPKWTVPRVDGDFLPDHPAELLKKGHFHQVDLISGITQHEGALLTASLYEDIRLLKQLDENFRVYGPLMLNFEEESFANQLTGKSFEFYLHNRTAFREKDADILTHLFGDRLCKVSQDDTAMLHIQSSSSGKKVFLYELEHQGLLSINDRNNISVSDDWVSHADLTQYLFSAGLTFPPFTTPDDVMLSDIVVSLWTNFAISGNPTPDRSLGFVWNEATYAALQHLSLTSSPAMQDDDRSKIRLFWHSLPTLQNKMLYPELINSSLWGGDDDGYEKWSSNAVNDQTSHKEGLYDDDQSHVFTPVSDETKAVEEEEKLQTSLTDEWTMDVFYDDAVLESSEYDEKEPVEEFKIQDVIIEECVEGKIDYKEDENGCNVKESVEVELKDIVHDSMGDWGSESNACDTEWHEGLEEPLRKSESARDIEDHDLCQEELKGELDESDLRCVRSTKDSSEEGVSDLEDPSVQIVESVYKKLHIDYGDMNDLFLENKRKIIKDDTIPELLSSGGN